MSGSSMFGPSAPQSSLGPPGAGAVGGSGGLLRVVTPERLSAMDAAESEERARRRAEAAQEVALDDLAAHVRKQFDMMRRHRDGATGWTDRLLAALRAFNRKYDPNVLAEIHQFGGSEVYAGIVAGKCRAAAAMLRDIYINGQTPWDIEPTPVPTLPEEATGAVDEMVEAEKGNQEAMAQTGAVDPATGQPLTPPTEEELAARKLSLQTQLDEGVRRKAREESKEAFRYIHDRLVEGRFYHALSEALADLTLFPFAVVRGPVVHMVPSVKWDRQPDGTFVPKKELTPRMFWQRVSPFDFWFTPGASTIESAEVIYRQRKSRVEINAMLGVNGYKDDAIRQVLTDYASGYAEEPDSADSIRADLENRENPHMNESGMYDILEYHGYVQGEKLLSWGMPKSQITDAVRDYSVQLWMIGRHVIKVQLAMSPRERPPFYITSFDKVPGTLVGNAIPDIIQDVEDVCNACLRALVNNMAMGSGPQVAVDTDLLAPGEDYATLHPWRVWAYARRPGMVGNGTPVSFFQPETNAQQLLGVYEKFTQIGDEVSAIPRYMTGSERMGGAGRTASGLAMLMGNASKMMQTVASNVDADIIEPVIQYLYEVLLLTDKSGKLRGDEKIVVKGVSVAMQRETERQRQIEFLQATANPLDSQIVGLRGRGALLRAVAATLGLDGESIAPSDEVLAAREKAMEAAALAQAQQQAMQPPQGAQQPPNPAAQAQGAQRGGAETGPSAIQGPRANLSEQPPA